MSCFSDCRASNEIAPPKRRFASKIRLEIRQIKSNTGGHATQPFVPEHRVFYPYKAGDFIFKEGDAGDEMYVVLEGEVDVIVHEKIVETVSVDNFLGEMALIDSRPRSATAVARTDCKLAPINQNRFKFLVQQTPHFALHLMQGMAERLRQRG